MISPWLLPTPPPHQTIVLRHSSGPDLPSPAPLAGAPLPTEYSRNTVPPEPSARCPASHSVLAHGFPWVPDAPPAGCPFPRHAQPFPTSTPWSGLFYCPGDDVHSLKVSPSSHGGECSSLVEGAWWGPGHLTPRLCQ